VNWTITDNLIDFYNRDATATEADTAISGSGGTFSYCTISNNIFRESDTGGAVGIHFGVDLNQLNECVLVGNVAASGTTLFNITGSDNAYGADSSGTQSDQANR
jgi:hypothetical protein